jgi:alkylation response protein AidB-like acyl-CoA dehydrogenase
MDELIRLTSDHLKNRRQFGHPLAKLQALQHALADMAIAHSQADAATWMAGSMLTGGEDVQRNRVLAAAKYEVGRRGRYTGQRAIQLHGAMGITDESIVSHHFKRLVGIDLLYGGYASQLHTFANLSELRISRPQGRA